MDLEAPAFLDRLANPYDLGSLGSRPFLSYDWPLPGAKLYTLHLDSGTFSYVLRDLTWAPGRQVISNYQGELSCACKKVKLSWGTTATFPLSYTVRRDGEVIPVHTDFVGSLVDRESPQGRHTYTLEASGGGEFASESCEIDVPLDPCLDPVEEFACEISPCGRPIVRWSYREGYGESRREILGTLIRSPQGQQTTAVNLVTSGELGDGPYRHLERDAAPGVPARYQVSVYNLAFTQSSRYDGELEVPAVDPCVGDIALLVCDARPCKTVLTWVNPDEVRYNKLEVLRDDEVIADLPVDALAFTDENPEAGEHSYTVRVRIGLGRIETLSCEVTSPGCSDGSASFLRGDLEPHSRCTI